jgi:hypothetical protein
VVPVQCSAVQCRRRRLHCGAPSRTRHCGVSRQLQRTSALALVPHADHAAHAYAYYRRRGQCIFPLRQRQYEYCRLGLEHGRAKQSAAVLAVCGFAGTNHSALRVIERHCAPLGPLGHVRGHRHTHIDGRHGDLTHVNAGHVAHEFCGLGGVGLRRLCRRFPCGDADLALFPRPTAR